MSHERIKRWRPLSLTLMVIGCVGIVLAMLGQRETLFLVAALVASSSLAFFVFTEGFLFTLPERTRLGIWVARFYFVLSVPVVVGIVAAFFVKEVT